MRHDHAMRARHPVAENVHDADRFAAANLSLPLTSGIAVETGFSSKERDASGLVYYGFRYYSPELCRWITPDPIREDGGLNLYRFCGNDVKNYLGGIVVQNSNKGS